jgi:RNA polymerase sigma factor (sigma-70 family)
MSAAVAPAPLRLTPEQQRLVEQNTGLAYQVAWRYIRGGAAAHDAVHDLEDFHGVALMGLCRAAARFDQGRGLKFSTLAVPYIMGELRRYMRDVRPGGIHWGRRVPFDEQVAPCSLDAPVGDRPNPKLLMEYRPDDSVDVETAAVLSALIAELPPQLCRVVRLAQQGLTQGRIAERLSVSQAQVCRLLRTAYARLRAGLEDGGERLDKLHEKILSALQSLPYGVPVRRIADAVGQEVTTVDMRPLVNAGLVRKVERTEGPVIGYRLTADGSKEADHIRQFKHPDVRTPEMAVPPPTGSLRERVTREQLREAIMAGRSLAWMSMKFDATVGGLQALIDEYGLWLEIADEGRANNQAPAPGQTDGAKEEENMVQAGTAEAMKHRPGKVAERKEELYARFAAGKGETKAQVEELAKEFGCGPTTINYWRNKWIAEQKAAADAARPVSATPEPDSVAQAPITEPAGETLTPDQSELMPQDQEIVTAALETMGVTPGPEVANAEQNPGDAPPTADQLQALKQHFAGGGKADAPTCPPSAPQGTPPTVSSKRLPEAGQVCEGVIWRVEPAYALVDLVETFDGRRHLRGKLSKFDAPKALNSSGDMRDLLREGDLVNAVVTKVEPRHMGNGWNVFLSLRNAPPHEQEPETLRHARVGEAILGHRPEQAPIVARGADVAAEVQNGHAPQAPAAVTDEEIRASQAQLLPKLLDVVRADKVEVVNICLTCVKRDVCPVALEDYYDTPIELPAENKPEKLKSLRVVYGRRFVQECSSYRREYGA